MINVSKYTVKAMRLSSASTNLVAENTLPQQKKFDLFYPWRQWLENLEITSPILARRLCKLIPSQCPFARQIKFWGHTLITIPPLCKLNPLYEELMTLRFRALCYLADECGEDITLY